MAMKKLLCMLLCIMLLIPAAAFAAQGDVTFSSTSGQLDQYGISGEFRSFCAVGDTLYLLTYDGKLLSHTVGDAEPKVYTSDFEDENSEPNSYTYNYMFSAGDKLYILKSKSTYAVENDTQKVESTVSTINEVEFSGDQATCKQLCEVDLQQLADNSDGYTPYIQYVVGAGDYAVLYTDDGSSGVASVWCASMVDGSMKRVDVVSDGSYLMNLVPYVNNTVLTQVWGSNGQSIVFYSIDPAAGTCQQISEVPVEAYSSFNGVAVDQATGTVYCVQGGEVHTIDLTTGALGDAITDVTTDSSDGCILAGGYYAVADYQSYLIRNINPGQQNTRRMKISSTGYGSGVDAAYYTFANAHGDVSVVYSHEYSEIENLIQDMMNRSSDTDVYILSVDNGSFTALYQRGYLADFTGSQKLMELANSIQPEFLEQLSVNGKFSVLPVNGYFYIPYLNRTAMEKAGISEEEVPTNWADFLQWIPTLQDRLPSGMSLFDPWTSDRQAKTSFFYTLFQCYQNYLQLDPNCVSANDMVSILQTLEQIDFNALGQPTEEETMSDNYSPDWNEENILMELNSGRNISGVATRYYPLVMSLKSGLDPILPMDATVAIINPFSQNADLALEFVETLADKMDDETAYTIRTDKTEQVPNEWYEDSLKNIQEYIDSLNEQLETAAEVDKQQIEETIKSAQESMKSMENDRWSISDMDIEWMNAHRSELRLSGDNWLYSDDSGDAYTLMQQYVDGQIDATRLMKEIDRKVRMRIMEGA